MPRSNKVKAAVISVAFMIAISAIVYVVMQPARGAQVPASMLSKSSSCVKGIAKAYALKYQNPMDYRVFYRARRLCNYVHLDMDIVKKHTLNSCHIKQAEHAVQSSNETRAHYVHLSAANSPHHGSVESPSPLGGQYVVSSLYGVYSPGYTHFQCKAK